MAKPGFDSKIQKKGIMQCHFEIHLKFYNKIHFILFC